MRDWNKGQRLAMEARCPNLLVSASAGTGKTAVMVERLIRRLTDPRDPLEMDRFLMVTFTNAAAREMRSRISQRLEEAAGQDGNGRWLRRQQALLGRAAISTLHAFCLELIRQNYQLLELDPQSRILNEAEQILLKQQVLEELLEARYEAGEADFLSLAASFGGEKNDRPLRELILSVYAFAASQPRPLAWLEKCGAVYRRLREARAAGTAAESADPRAGAGAGRAAEDYLPFLSTLYHRVKEELGDMAVRLKAGAESCRGFSALEGYRARAEEESAALEVFAKAPDWDSLILGLTENGEVFGRLPSVAAKPRQEEGLEEFMGRLKTQAGLKELRDQIKKAYKQLREPLLGEYQSQMLWELAAMAPAMEGLAAAVRDFTLAYQEAKREKASIDFSDIEQQALLLLTDEAGQPSDLALSLRQRYLEVLVDEYQDINPAQEEILKAVAGESFFMVGDVKQSIYGFRQAAPELFLEKYHRFRDQEAAQAAASAKGESGAGGRETGKVILLEENYRSSQLILEGINSLFDQIMTPEIGGVSYQEEGRFTCGSPRPESALPARLAGKGRGPLELHLIDQATSTKNPEQENEDEEDPEALRLEALLAARRILELRREGIWDDKARLSRPLAWRDIAVLLPAMSNVAEVFTEVLRSQEIPVFADMGSGYFSAQEVRTAVSFLKVVDNPRQDIPLAALLLSPAYGFTPAELAEIRLVKKQSGLYECLVYYARANRGPLGRRLRDWLGRLRQYRRLSRRDSMERLLLRFYEDTGFLTLASAMAGGRQRQANLRALILRARQFEESNMKGLYQFIRYLDALEKSGTDLSAAAVIGENEDVVRIMSIHKSKGLEFPVVLLATCGRRFNQRDAGQDVLTHRELGLASVVLEPGKRVKYPGAYHLAVSAGLRRERLAESQRLLYVALTRARERLILISCPQRASEKLEAWRREGRPAGSEWVFRAKSFLDWLGPVVAADAEDAAGLWTCRLWQPESLLSPARPAEVSRALWRAVVKEARPDSTGFYSEIDQALSWRYPYQGAAQAPAKLSVTQARGRLYPEEDPESAKARWLNPLIRPSAEPPAFIAGPAAEAPLARGTALHKLLSQIEPAKALKSIGQRRESFAPAGEEAYGKAAAAYLEELAEGLLSKRFLTPREKEYLDTGPLLRYLRGPLFLRAAAADARGLCQREASFTISIPARRLYPDLGAAGEDPVMIQGAIDLFFEEEEELVLVDYKTDRVRPGEEERLVRDYRGQLLLYGEALLALSGGKPIKELLIYSLALGKTIPVI